MSSESDDFARLGTAIGKNTYITNVDLCRNTLHDIKTINLLEGLKCNSSITSLALNLERSEPTVPHKLLSVYQEKKNLTQLSISRADLQNGGDNIIATTLQCCTNLEQLVLFSCNITTEQLSSMVEPIRSSLQRLDLHLTEIGNTGCEALARLLRDPLCMLKSLSLLRNNISDAGVIAIANSLNSNSNLEKLYFAVNHGLDQLGAADTFSNLLCNTTSMDSIILPIIHLKP